MRIVVTGANGFLGTHAVRRLAERGHVVRGFLLKGTAAGDAAPWLAEVIEGDVREPADAARAVEGCEALVHLAAWVADSGPAARFYDVNVKGTRVLLDAAVQAGLRRFVFTSSLTVHGFGDFCDATEDQAYDFNGVNAYARSKIACERLLAHAHAKGRVQVAVVRPAFFPYGEHDRLSLPGLLGMLKGRLVPLPGGRDPRLGTVHGDNLGDGLALCAEHPAAAGQAFVIGDEGGLRFTDLYRALARAAGLPPPRFVPLPMPLARGVAGLVEGAWAVLPLPGLAPLSRYRLDVATHSTHFSIDKARRVLGYRPLVARDEGLERAVRAVMARTVDA
jgi:nucleoside-diphosphate-sugar epimerase